MIRKSVAVTLYALLATSFIASSCIANVLAEDHAVKRQLFQKAERAFNQGKMAQFKRLKQNLRDYPLFPYLEFKQQRNRFQQLNQADIERFHHHYQDTPLPRRLEAGWLSYLTKQQRWSQFLVAYDHYQRSYGTPSHINTQCSYRTALLKTGRTQQAIADIDTIWLTAKSRPKLCDPVLKAWRTSPAFDSELVWQRIRLAMDRSNLQLTQYLKKLLPPTQQLEVEQWLAVHRQPGKQFACTLKSTQGDRSGLIFRHAIQRINRKESLLANQLWHQHKDKFQLTPALSAQTSRSLALRLGKRHHPRATEFLELAQQQQPDTQTLAWAVRSALYQQDWLKVMALIEAMEPAEQTSSRWRYWQARAHQQLGYPELAQLTLKQLAKERDYYGFIAADLTRSPYSFNDTTFSATPAQLNKVLSRPAFGRIGELIKLGRQWQANSEWNLATKTMPREQVRVAAHLASQWDWHIQAITTLAKNSYWHDLDARFPVSYKTQVYRNAHTAKVQPTWVYGILRTESAFNAKAHSSAGARGLMQLMPATGKMVAKQLGFQLKNQRQLYDVETNIKLGSSYLGQMQQKFGNTFLATAAYNAGPRNVTRWLPKLSDLPADIWIETIPYNETRNYVSRVLAYSVIYQNRLGQPVTRLSSHLSPVKATGDVVANKTSPSISLSSRCYRWKPQIVKN